MKQGLKARILLIAVGILLHQFVLGQQVGVVLSGGGARGLAHIGVLKALEEHQIPIDYITGTSIGAMVGGMYAAGFSPGQMELLFTSETFLNMANGELEDQYTYYFSQVEEDAGWASIKFYKDSIWKTSTPTNLISPVPLDFEIMAQLAEANAASKYNFDSLMIPFRCNAADIASKESKVFKEGDLGTAIRASMSYPFYLKPLRVDGKLLFDGGLYNNFPADIMKEDFKPDFMIGCNVSSNEAPPQEDDLLSQIRNMVVSKTNFSLFETKGIILEPKVNSGVFDFNNAQAVIDSGYVHTIAQIEAIKALIPKRVKSSYFEERRATFNKGKDRLLFENIEIEGLNRRQKNYVKRLLLRKRQPTLTLSQLKKSYFRLFGDDNIKSIYPTAKQKEGRKTYDLLLKVKKEKDLIVDFGGNFASTPINTAFIGLKYNHLGNSAVTVRANSYFGKLYGSAQTKVRMDFPTSVPFYLEGGITLNRWNYFRSQSFFFEEERPTYLLQNERFADLIVGFPVRNKDRIQVGGSIFNLTDEYYQIPNFAQADTADETDFNGNSFFINYERSNLNYKLYPNSGAYLGIRGRFVLGEEFNRPGSTSDLNRNFTKLHEWWQLKFKYENYYMGKGHLRMGLLVEGVWSNQLLFNNFTATILRAPGFQPTPESKTLFLEPYRALQYAAIGHRFIFNIWNNFDFRLEGHLFQPYKYIVEQETQLPDAVIGLDDQFFVATATAVFHSPLGPLSAGLNYYHDENETGFFEDNPITFLFHFGYIIFNQRALN